MVVDRTQSTAFMKKGDREKRVRSGTTTSVNMASANPLYYAAVPKPQLVTLDAKTAKESHIDTVMEIDSRFLYGIGSGCYPGYLGNDFKLFGKPALLYRKFTHDLLDQVAKNAKEAPKRASVLNGRNGAGKSAELLKAASVAASSGHIVIYAHSAVTWVNSSRPYAPQSGTNMFTQPELATELLRSVSLVSGNALARVPLGKEIALGKKKSLDATKTLADLVNVGLQTPSLAHIVLENLLEVASTQTKVPVLLAIDEVNSLWCNTLYRDQSDNILPANRLRLINTMLPFFEGKQTLAKGWVLGASSYSDLRFMPKDLNKRLNPPAMIPLANAELSKDLVAFPPTELPFDVIPMGTISAIETWALMHFYHKTNVIASPITKAIAGKRWLAASGNPRRIFAGVTSYF
ncbi:hypothetical protein IW136_002751 [Coemansia sp. RSA 678]|nr:hypothetical protein IW136_002751 [Coemansia sp. RSA 678]